MLVVREGNLPTRLLDPKQKGENPEAKMQDVIETLTVPTALLEIDFEKNSFELKKSNLLKSDSSGTGTQRIGRNDELLSGKSFQPHASLVGIVPYSEGLFKVEMAGPGVLTESSQDHWYCSP